MPSDANDKHRDQPNGRMAPRLRSTILLAVVGLVMIGAAVYVYFSTATIERWLRGLPRAVPQGLDIKTIVAAFTRR